MKNNDFSQVMLIILGIFLGIFLIITVIILTTDPVSFGITLNKQDFIYGENLVLDYSISNWWPNSITNISVTTYVYQKNNPEGSIFREQVIFDKSNLFNKIKGNYTQELNLPEGEYKISSNLNYIRPNGKLEHKELSLEFDVKYY